MVGCVTVLFCVTDFGEKGDVEAAGVPTGVGEADVNGVERFIQLGEITDGSAGKPCGSTVIRGRSDDLFGGSTGENRGRQDEREQEECFHNGTSVPDRRAPSIELFHISEVFFAD